MPSHEIFFRSSNSTIYCSTTEATICPQISHKCSHGPAKTYAHMSCRSTFGRNYGSHSILHTEDEFLVNIWWDLLLLLTKSGLKLGEIGGQWFALTDTAGQFIP